MTPPRSQIARFVAIFAGGTMLSRVLGLLRDIIIARFIPLASQDAFILAFRFPNMLRDILGEGAANGALVPAFSEAHEKEDRDGFQRAIRAVMGAMLLAFCLVTLIAIVLLPLFPVVLRLVQPITGSDSAHIAEFAARVPLMQWSFPYLIFICLTVFATAPLFVLKHYSTPAWSPALLNVALILCCLAFYRYFQEPAWALVMGVWLGGFAQFAVMFRAMHRETGVLLPTFQLRHPAVRQVFWLLVPVALGQATGEVNKLVNSFFAASIDKGVVAALYYADRIIQLPMGVFAVAVSVAILPELSRANVRGEHTEFRDSLKRGFLLSAFLVLPAMGGILVLAQPIVRVLFESGNFDHRATAMAARATVIYGAGLLAYAWIKVAVQGFYAVQETRTPVLIATTCMFLNIVLNFLLVRPLGYQGLALSTTLSFYLNMLILIIMLQRRHGHVLDRKWLGELVRIIIAATLMSALVYGLHLLLRGMALEANRLYEALALTGLIATGALTFAAASYLLGVQELHALLRLRKRRASPE